MQAAAYIFIHRKWKDDKSHFEDMIDYFCDIREPLQLLLFPEGTDLTGKVAWAWITELHNMKGKWKWSRSLVSDSLTLCHTMDCSQPGSSVHGVFQAIVVEWIAISFFNMKVLWNQLSSLNFSVLRQLNTSEINGPSLESFSWHIRTQNSWCSAHRIYNWQLQEIVFLYISIIY